MCINLNFHNELKSIAGYSEWNELKKEDITQKVSEIITKLEAIKGYQKPTTVNINELTDTVVSWISLNLKNINDQDKESLQKISNIYFNLSLNTSKTHDHLSLFLKRLIERNIISYAKKINEFYDQELKKKEDLRIELKLLRENLISFAEIIDVFVELGLKRKEVLPITIKLLEENPYYVTDNIDKFLKVLHKKNISEFIKKLKEIKPSQVAKHIEKLVQVGFDKKEIPEFAENLFNKKPCRFSENVDKLVKVGLDKEMVPVYARKLIDKDPYYLATDIKTYSNAGLQIKDLIEIVENLFEKAPELLAHFIGNFVDSGLDKNHFSKLTNKFLKIHPSLLLEKIEYFFKIGIDEKEMTRLAKIFFESHPSTSADKFHLFIKAGLDKKIVTELTDCVLQNNPRAYGRNIYKFVLAGINKDIVLDLAIYYLKTYSGLFSEEVALNFLNSLNQKDVPEFTYILLQKKRYLVVNNIPSFLKVLDKKDVLDFAKKIFRIDKKVLIYMMIEFINALDKKDYYEFVMIVIEFGAFKVAMHIKDIFNAGLDKKYLYPITKRLSEIDPLGIASKIDKFITAGLNKKYLPNIANIILEKKPKYLGMFIDNFINAGIDKDLVIKYAKEIAIKEPLYLIRYINDFQLTITELMDTYEDLVRYHIPKFDISKLLKSIEEQKFIHLQASMKWAFSLFLKIIDNNISAEILNDLQDLDGTKDKIEKNHKMKPIVRQRKEKEIKNLFIQIMKYRNPQMKTFFTDSIFKILKENPNVFKKINFSRNHAILPNILLILFHLEGINDKKCVDFSNRIVKNHFLRDFRYSQPFNNTLKIILESQIGRSDKEYLLDLIIPKEIEKSIIKEQIQNIQMVPGIHYLNQKALGESYLKKNNNDFKNILENEFFMKFPFLKVKNFSQKYHETILKLRKYENLFIYAGKLEQERKLQNLLSQLIEGIMTNTFLLKRYDLKNNPHMKKVFEGRDALLEKWKEGKVISLEERKNRSTKIRTNFIEIFKQEFNDNHISKTEFPFLYRFLFAQEELKELNHKDDPKILVQKLAIELVTSQEEKTQIDLLIEMIKLLHQMDHIPKEFLHTIQGLHKIIRQVRQDVPPDSFTNIREHCPGDKARIFGDEDGVTDCLNCQKGCEKCRLTSGWTIVDTDDPWDLFLCGTEVEGSCQRVGGNIESNKCLLGYVLDGKNRLIAMRNERGELQSRMIMRVLINEDDHPVLFIERIYPRVLSDNFKQLLINFAKDRAKELGLDLLSKEVGEGKAYVGTIRSEGGPAPYDYSDAGGGICQDGYISINNSYVIFSNNSGIFV